MGVVETVAARSEGKELLNSEKDVPSQVPREHVLIYMSHLESNFGSLDSREMVTIPDSIYCHLHLKYLMRLPMEDLFIST